MSDLYDRTILCNALSFVYRMIVASAPLLEFAIPRSGGGLREYYERHLVEERGHDLMLLDDLKRLDVEPPPSHFAAQFSGSQYYLIAHEHPALLLGYMRALEANPLPVAEVDSLSEHHGTSLTALRHHAVHDVEHARELNSIIAAQPADMRGWIEWNERNILALLNAPRGEA